jgi:2,5-furandicarboxylate decarboxylase 1
VSKDLREFLKVVKAAGSEFYVEVTKPLKPEFEKDILQLKLQQQGRFPVIFCPEIEGSKLPLVSNLFGSYEMLGLAMDMDPKVSSKSDVFHEFRRRRGRKTKPQEVPAAKAPVKEVILKGRDVDLGLLPINYHAPLNSAKYIPMGNMICKNPENGIPNVGVYRHELKGKDKLGAWFSDAHHSSYHARRYAETGKPMEVAIFIGHHPAVILGSVSAGPVNENEFEVMGGFLGEPVRIVKAETVDLPVPADAEIVIEGIIDPRNMVTDAPFCEWTGYYGLKRPCYLIDVKCITMRHDAIYHDLAPSHREHNITGVLGYTSVVYGAVKAVVPTVKDVYLPYSGRHDMSAYVSIKQRVSGEAKRAALAAVNIEAPIMFVVVVDDDIDVYNEEEVMWAILTRARADRDIIRLPGVISSPLNPRSYNETRLEKGIMTTKWIIDATRPVELPFPTRVIPPVDLWNSMKLEDYVS